MKAITKIFIVIVTLILFGQCEKDELIPIVNIPDDNFLTALIELGVDTNGDSIISLVEAELITVLKVNGKEISSMSGLEDCKQTM